MPKWGPFANESWGEPYNRATGLLRATLTSMNRWNERLGKPAGLESTPINMAELPSFMQTTTASTSIPIVTVREPVVMIEPKVMQIYWNDARPRREILEKKHEKVPSLTQEAPDIRAFSATEWRDKTRHL